MPWRGLQEKSIFGGQPGKCGTQAPVVYFVVMPGGGFFCIGKMGESRGAVGREVWFLGAEQRAGVVHFPEDERQHVLHCVLMTRLRGWELTVRMDASGCVLEVICPRACSGPRWPEGVSAALAMEAVHRFSNSKVVQMLLASVLPVL